MDTNHRAAAVVAILWQYLRAAAADAGCDGSLPFCLVVVLWWLGVGGRPPDGRAPGPPSPLPAAPSPSAPAMRCDAAPAPDLEAVAFTSPPAARPGAIVLYSENTTSYNTT